MNHHIINYIKFLESVFAAVAALLAAFVTAIPASALGHHFIDNFSELALGQGGQTWDIGVFDDDLVFFANKDGVYRYDGNRWTAHRFNNGLDARAVCADREHHRIYISGINEFGYLSPDRRGFMKYTCLSDSIGEDRLSGNMWGIYNHNDVIFVQADQSILRISGRRHSVINSPVKLDCSSMINGVLYLGTEQGLKMLVGDAILTAHGTDELRGMRIRGILPYDDRLLIVTVGSGLYSYDGRSLSKFDVAGDFIRHNEIFCAAITGKRYLALGSILNGVAVVDLATGRTTTYDQSVGLQDNTVLSLAFDHRGDLWVGLDNGIDRINLTDPVTKLISAGQRIGAGYAAITHKNKIYLGTNRGLFYCDTPTDGSSISKLRSVGNNYGQVWGLAELDDRLFCLHDRGLLEIDGETTSRIDGLTGVWQLLPVKGHNDLCYAGTYGGISLLARHDDGDWSLSGTISNLDESVYNMAQDGDGYVWFFKSAVGAVRLKIDLAAMKVVESRAYGIEKGLPSVNDVSISEIDDNIHFATPEGAFIYDATGDTIVRDTPLEKRIGVQSLLKVWRDKDFIYALTPREIIRCRVSLAEDIRRLPVIPEHARPLNLCVAMFAVDDTTMIYPNYSGYTVFNFGKRNETDTDVTAGAICHIRMKNAEDSVIISDSFSNDRKALHISHSNNSVVIEFSAPDRYLSMIKGYSYRLNDEPWSTPSMNTVKEYTNLDGGDYVFEIKTMLIDGREHVSSVSFEVEHPWYRRLWFIALTIIICIATAMSAFFVLRRRINSRQQKLIKAKDAFIARQKAEFESIDEMKDRKIDELEKENLHNELEHKSQEIINLLLSLSNKNEALISIKEELKNISVGLKGDAATRKSLMILQSSIEASLESGNVLERIENEFNIVHNNFIKNIRSRYPALTTNELLLCAYIKMNLATKEIAPLMNMSVRGVETIRYRMRKKLSLEREESLTDFLNKFK